MANSGKNSHAADLDLSKIKGLTSAEVEERWLRDGANELQHEAPKSTFAIVIEVIQEPMFLLLTTCAALTFILGDIEEGAMLSMFVLFVIVITIIQERKTERALDALRDLSAPRAVVIRDGEQTTVAGRFVVVDDIIILKEGDRVAADITITWAMNLSADESLLTGESVAVRKCACSPGNERDELDKPGGDDTPTCFSGSLICGGKGLGVVRAVGVNTRLGQIGKSLAEVEPEKTPLETETNRLVMVMAIIGCSLSAGVFVCYGMMRDDWLEGALVALSLAMGLLPEEFPVIFTVFMALGSWRISKSQVLTRRSSAIETLGSCTVLCTDKTGTLTMNQMMVQGLYDVVLKQELIIDDPTDPQYKIDECYHHIVENALLASQRDPFDPMELALKSLIDHGNVDDTHRHSTWDMLKEYPLSKEMMAMTRVYRSNEHGELIVSVKGAPEAVGDLCHLDDTVFGDVRAVVNRFANLGLRVLGVATASVPKESTERLGSMIQHDFEFQLLGLIGFADPIRPTVPDAVASAYDAGIQVVMITGDYPGTARAIAKKIGLRNTEHVITGPELEKMTDKQLTEAIQDVAIFARIVPEQKLQIVRAFKARGEIVGMTGDGVNDAPALKGISMGKKGTDVAREASHLVLLDDDFSSIVRAVRLGRRIFDNLQKAFAYVISIHVPLAGLVLFPVLFGWNVILRPSHIMMLEMIIDPACSVVLEAEPEEEDVMSRKPRDQKKRMISRSTALTAILQGMVILVACLAIYHLATHDEYGGASDEQTSALTFAVLIFANLFLIIEDRSWSSSLFTVLKPMTIMLLAVVPLLCFVMFTPGVQKMFRFADVKLVYVPIALIAGMITTLWFEFYKCARRNANNPKSKSKAKQSDIEMGNVFT